MRRLIRIKENWIQIQNHKSLKIQIVICSVVFLFAFNLSLHLQKHNLCTFFKEIWPLHFWEYWLLSSEWPQQDGSCLQHVHTHTEGELWQELLVMEAADQKDRNKFGNDPWRSVCQVLYWPNKGPRLLTPDRGSACDPKRSLIVTLRPRFEILNTWIIGLGQYGRRGV